MSMKLLRENPLLRKLEIRRSRTSQRERVSVTLFEALDLCLKVTFLLFDDDGDDDFDLD